ncbi:MAG: STAUR_1299 family protein, partial [Deltaproteobacteria bacterium]
MADLRPTYLGPLLDKSFEIIPGELYNQYRLEVAERLGDSYLFYEFSLLEEKPWRTLRERTYPLFARYIKAKLIDPTTANGVVVAIFHG